MEVMDTQAGDMVHIPPPVNAPLSLIERAIEKGVDAEQLGRLMDLYERMAKQKSEEAYAVAMNACQAVMPSIVRRKTNTQTKTTYAPLEDVIEVAKPIYTAHGFSLSFSEAQGAPAGFVRLECDVKHSRGHTERKYGDFPRDETGFKGTPNKTAIQGQGSTQTYGRRYMVKMIFNIVETDEDDDGNSAGGLITVEQRQELEAIVTTKKGGIVRFLAWAKTAFGIDSLDQMQAKDFKKAMDVIKRVSPEGAPPT